MDVYEILDDLEKIKDRDNKIEWLRENYRDHKPLEYIIRFNYDKNIVSMLPSGEPPFNKEEIDGPSRSSLWNYLQMFPVIVKSAQSSKMRMIQIEKIFIEMLESVSTKEAELVCMAKDRMLESKYSIDLEMFEEAFNLGLIPAKMPEIIPKSPEELATEMLMKAASLKEKSKAMAAQAKELETEAKKLAAEA
jgi:hypothetical protein